MRFSSLILHCTLVWLIEPDEQRVAGLIQSLRDPDPVHRKQAGDELRRLGSAARQALVSAARSEDASISASAGEILLALPWFHNDDPPVVRQSLLRYGQSDPAARVEAVHRLATTYPRPLASRILMRLLLEDPSEDVCWRIVSLLRQMMDSPAHEALRAIDASQTRASVLTLAARASFHTDRRRARALLQRAIEIESQAPTMDGGEFDFAFDALCGAAINAGAFDQAARLRRLQSSRGGAVAESADHAVYQLFALHARYGPLAGFDGDLPTFGVYLGEPQVLYAIAAIHDRCGQPVVAHACRQAAEFSSLTSSRRGAVAQFLRQNHFDDPAERELSAIVRGDEPGTILERIQARFELADMAGKAARDTDAAEQLQAALDTIEQSNLQLEVTDGAGQRVPFELAMLRARILWRKFRAARAANDPAADRLLEQLLVTRAWNMEVLVDLVPYLESISREQDARMMFEAEYRKLQTRLAQDPRRPLLLNELAWLCARSGERPKEAMEFATRAVEAAPGEAGYLDTLAEANFQLANFDEAIRLEEAALDLEPTDPFMLEQLERFKRGKAPGN